MITLMPKCVLTIAKGSNNYRTIAVTLWNCFADSDHALDNYVQIISVDKDTVIFTKKNYAQIVNSTSKKELQIELIVNYLQDKYKNPLQGMLFE